MTQNLPVHHNPHAVALPDAPAPKTWLNWFLENPSRSFWILFLAHLVLWTIIPAISQPNAPLDVIEGLAWGREWPLGTYKHPPLQAWLLESATYIFGQSGLGYFGLSAICGAVTLWSVYRTGRLFTTPTHALVATLLTEGVMYLNLLSTEFNPNVLQLVLAALATYAFTHALMRGKLKYWLLLGLIFALGLYSKYSFLLFGLSFLLFMLWRKETRRFILGPYSYAALGVLLLLSLPHIQWLASHDFLPLKYAGERSVRAADIGQQLYFPLKFLSAQILAMLPALMMLGIMYVPLDRVKQGQFRGTFLAWMAWGPLVISIVLSLFTGQQLRDMWGMPMLSFIPLWFVANFTVHEKRLEKSLLVAGIIPCITLLAFLLQMTVVPMLGFKPLRGHFPGRELAATLNQTWQTQMQTPLRFVIGDAWIAGNTAFYAPDVRNRPHVWIDAGENTSQWIRRDEVMLNGGIVTWRQYSAQPDAGMPEWARNLPNMVVQKPLLLPWHASTKADPVMIGWAILLPANRRSN